jgi:(p)ppGpp synthase/HD superfamily hydrolase
MVWVPRQKPPYTNCSIEAWEQEAPLDPLTVVLQAGVRAAAWHTAQRRKGAAQEPYVNHLLEVASLVAEATGGEDVDLVVAALLHDAIEDQQIPRAAIAREFGEDVAALVMEATDDKALPKPQRKRLQVEHAPKTSARAALLKLADKTSNLMALASSPPADWPEQRRLDYVQWARDVVAGLRVDNAWLRKRFDDAADAAERSVITPAAAHADGRQGSAR